MNFGKILEEIALRLTEYFIDSLERRTVRHSWLKYTIAPATTFASTVAIDLLQRFEWYTLSLVLPFALFSLSCLFSNIYASLLAALIYSGYVLIETGFDPARSWQNIGAALLMALTMSAARRLIVHSAQQEALIRRAEEFSDNFNGNRTKIAEALAKIIEALENWDSYSREKLYSLVRDTRYILANLLSLIESWDQINQSRQAAYDYLDSLAGYPYKADQAIKEIHGMTRQIYASLDYALKEIEKTKEKKNDE